jgi:hypothetical protein
MLVNQEHPFEGENRKLALKVAGQDFGGWKAKCDKWVANCQLETKISSRIEVTQETGIDWSKETIEIQSWRKAADAS